MGHGVRRFRRWDRYEPSSRLPFSLHPSGFRAGLGFFQESQGFNAVSRLIEELV